MVKRKGLIVAYKKLAQNGNETEGQTYIKDVERITHRGESSMLVLVMSVVCKGLGTTK